MKRCTGRPDHSTGSRKAKSSSPSVSLTASSLSKPHGGVSSGGEGEGRFVAMSSGRATSTHLGVEAKHLEWRAQGDKELVRSRWQRMARQRYMGGGGGCRGTRSDGEAFLTKKALMTASRWAWSHFRESRTPGARFPDQKAALQRHQHKSDEEHLPPCKDCS